MTLYVVLMGATAAQSVMGTGFKLTENRGRPLSSELAELVIATMHPSAILRAPDSEARRLHFEQLVHDLELVVAALRHDG